MVGVAAVAYVNQQTFVAQTAVSINLPYTVTVCGVVMDAKFAFAGGVIHLI